MSANKVLYDDTTYLEDFDFKGKTLIASQGNNDVSMIMIYSSGCPHCINAIPEYDKLAKKMKRDKGVKIYAIQADGERDSEKKLGAKVRDIVPGFKGYPTFVVFKNGSYVKSFEGARTAENFEKFIQEHK